MVNDLNLPTNSNHKFVLGGVHGHRRPHFIWGRDKCFVVDKGRTLIFTKDIWRCVENVHKVEEEQFCIGLLIESEFCIVLTHFVVIEPTTD